MNSHFRSIEMLRFKFFILSSYHVSPAEKKFEIWQFFCVLLRTGWGLKKYDKIGLETARRDHAGME